MKIYHLYSRDLIYGQSRLILTENQSKNKCIGKSTYFPFLFRALWFPILSFVFCSNPLSSWTGLALIFPLTFLNWSTHFGVFDFLLKCGHILQLYLSVSVSLSVSQSVSVSLCLSIYLSLALSRSLSLPLPLSLPPSLSLSTELWTYHIDPQIFHVAQKKKTLHERHSKLLLTVKARLKLHLKI